MLSPISRCFNVSLTRFLFSPRHVLSLFHLFPFLGWNLQILMCFIKAAAGFLSLPQIPPHSSSGPSSRICHLPVASFSFYLFVVCFWTLLSGICSSLSLPVVCPHMSKGEGTVAVGFSVRWLLVRQLVPLTWPRSVVPISSQPDSVQPANHGDSGLPYLILLPVSWVFSLKTFARLELSFNQA